MEKKVDELLASMNEAEGVWFKTNWSLHYKYLISEFYKITYKEIDPALIESLEVIKEKKRREKTRLQRLDVHPATETKQLSRLTMTNAQGNKNCSKNTRTVGS